MVVERVSAHWALLRRLFVDATQMEQVPTGRVVFTLLALNLFDLDLHNKPWMLSLNLTLLTDKTDTFGVYLLLVFVRLLLILDELRIFVYELLLLFSHFLP